MAACELDLSAIPSNSFASKVHSRLSSDTKLLRTGTANRNRDEKEEEIEMRRRRIIDSGEKRIGRFK